MAAIRPDEEKSREELLSELRDLRRALDVEQGRKRRRTENQAFHDSQFSETGKRQRAIQPDFEALSVMLLHEMFGFAALLDTDGNMILINSNGVENSGMPVEEFLFKPLWTGRWCLDEYRDDMRRGVEMARRGEFFRIELPVFGEQVGTPRIWIDFSIKPLYDRFGKLTFLAVEARNIHEKKLAEQKLARQGTELQHLYERVKELDELKTSFFASISHELRTPLTLILGPTNQMLSDPAANLTAHQRQQLEVVRTNAYTLLKHVQDLLDITKLDAQKMTLRRDVVDVSNLVSLACSHFEAFAAECSIDFRVVLPPDSPPPAAAAAAASEEEAPAADAEGGHRGVLASIDADKVQRCVMNLLSNAFKFAPRGGVIRVELRIDESPPPAESAVVVTVADSGPGIAPELRGKVFERFYQGDGGSLGKVKGTGLGLCIVKDFVALHGGSVTISDAAEGGAQFDIRLPRNLPPEASLRPISLSELHEVIRHEARQTLAELRDNPGPTPSLLTDSAASTANLVAGADAAPDADGSESISDSDDMALGAERPRVLLVEDHRDLNRFIVEQLSSDFELRSAFNGKAGLALAIEFRPDVIVTDLMMPEMSGDKMVAELRRAHPDLVDVPVLVLTAKADQELKLKLLRDGVADYISKPFSVPELKVRVANLCAMHRTRRTLQQELRSTTRGVEQLSAEIVTKQRHLQELYELVRQGRDEAQKLAAMKDEFLMTVSHELRTPLTGVIGLTELLQMDAELGDVDLDQLKKALETISQCAHAQLRIIDDLLDVSQLLKGKMGIRRAPVDLRATLVAAVDSVRLAGTARKLEISLDLPSRPVVINGDAGRIQQVLWNLLGNAIKFTNPGGKVVARLSVPDHEAPKGPLPVAVVSVSDTGRGIEPSQQQRLFRRFGQLDSSTTRSAEGLGLGLALCKQLVEAHGGSIQVESAGAGAGSTFTVVLPLPDGAPPPTDGPADLADSSPGPPPLHNLAVLVVDPDVVVRDLISAVLSREPGVRVSSFASADEASAALQSGHRPDIAFLQGGLAVREGQALLRSLRSQQPTVPVAAMTGNSHSTRKFELSFDAVLVKPFSASTLTETATKLTTLLRERR